MFVGSITSSIFEALFFQYSIIDFADYEHIYLFFIKGHFIIPFAMFYTIWIVTIGLTMVLFQLPNVYITKHFGKRIRTFLLWYYSSKGGTNLTSESILPPSKSMDWIYKSMRKESLQERALFRRTLQSHRALEFDYTLILRAFIAITIYFNELEYFGCVTFGFCVVILLFTWLLQIVKYQFLEVFPEIVIRNKDTLSSQELNDSSKSAEEVD